MIIYERFVDNITCFLLSDGVTDDYHVEIVLEVEDLAHLLRFVTLFDAHEGSIDTAKDA